MSNPQWLDDLFAGAMLAIALYSAGRLAASRAWGRPTHRDVDVAHVLMGVSMAGQLVSELNPVSNGAWELVFGSLALWFARRCYQFVRNPGTDSRYGAHVHRLSRRLIHLTMALAMLYMYLAATPARIGTGMAMGTASGTTSDFVLIPTVFVLALLASAIWQVDGIGRLAPQATDGPAPQRVEVVGGTVTEAAIPTGGSTGDGPVALAPAAPAVTARSTSGSPAGPAWLAPRIEAGAHIVMVVTMAYMLVLML